MFFFGSHVPVANRAVLFSAVGKLFFSVEDDVQIEQTADATWRKRRTTMIQQDKRLHYLPTRNYIVV